MVDVTPPSGPAPDLHCYDLDSMMEALIQGKGSWVYEKTRPLAESGLMKAQLMMGILHQIGAGVEQSGPEAVKYYRLAAQQGEVLAWRNLGTLYLLGLAGVDVDKSAAHDCFARARFLELQETARAMLDARPVSQ